MNPILSLLGLALRGGRLAVGEEAAALAARTGNARLLAAAQDAGGSTLRRTAHLAEAGHCLWLILPFSKDELGRALGRGTVAVAALTDLGLAAAVAKRLAALDPAAYGELSERMERKVRRAAERRNAPRRKPPDEPAKRPKREQRERTARNTRSGNRPQGQGRRPPGTDRPERTAHPPGGRKPCRGGPPGAEGHPFQKHPRSHPQGRRNKPPSRSGRGPGQHSGGPGRGGGR